MRRLNAIGVFCLLFLLTVGVIFLPPFVSEQNQNARLNETVYRAHSVASRAQIDSVQVAQLYCNRDVSIGPYNSMLLYDETEDTFLVKETATELLKAFFYEGMAADELIQDMLTSGTLYYSPNSILVNVGDQPIALVFVEVGIKKDDASVELMYEAKTRTLVRFSYDSLDLLCESENEGEEMLGKLRANVEHYYEQQLGLCEDNYYFVGQVSGATEFDLLYSSSYFGFGLLQSEPDAKGETLMEEIYILDTK